MQNLESQNANTMKKQNPRRRITHWNWVTETLRLANLCWSVYEINIGNKSENLFPFFIDQSWDLFVVGLICHGTYLSWDLYVAGLKCPALYVADLFVVVPTELTFVIHIYISMSSLELLILEILFNTSARGFEK